MFRAYARARAILARFQTAAAHLAKVEKAERVRHAEPAPGIIWVSNDCFDAYREALESADRMATLEELYRHAQGADNGTV